ncbi:MAG: LLM class flavin-dependent oxidoreductase [Acidimicrobiia bacterium]|nr:LLM class flavin-dependent oxidoreductase [Acidimicrobiia bacterium]
MRHGLVLPNWEAGSEVSRLVEAGVAAEESGWDGVFLADHLIFPPPPEIGARSTADEHWPMPDPWVTLSGIATRTSRIKLGTWITPVARRQPWQMARDLATLDRMSGGRVILGVGLGRRPDYEQFGQQWDLKDIASMTDEALDLIARLWSGDRVTHVGEHYQLQDVSLLPTPLQRPRIPVVVGGIWPRKPALRRGAKWDGIMTHFPADGVFPSDGDPPERHSTEMVDYYTSLTDQPGEIFLPANPEGASSEWADLAEGLGATWLYTAKHDGSWTLDLDVIRRGPASG